MKKLIALSALLATNVMAADLQVSLQPAQGFRNQYFNVLSNHSVSFTNTTDKPLNYTVFYKNCPFGEDCKVQELHVTLEAGKSFTDKRVLQQRAMYHAQGHFRSYAMTGIAGGDRGLKEVNGDIAVY